MGYEINPVTPDADCAPVQGFSVVQGDERIRTARAAGKEKDAT